MRVGQALNILAAHNADIDVVVRADGKDYLLGEGTLQRDERNGRYWLKLATTPAPEDQYSPRSAEGEATDSTPEARVDPAGPENTGDTVADGGGGGAGDGGGE